MSQAACNSKHRGPAAGRHAVQQPAPVHLAKSVTHAVPPRGQPAWRSHAPGRTSRRSKVPAICAAGKQHRSMLAYVGVSLCQACSLEP